STFHCRVASRAICARLDALVIVFGNPAILAIRDVPERGELVDLVVLAFPRVGPHEIENLRVGTLDAARREAHGGDVIVVTLQIPCRQSGAYQTITMCPL